MTKEQIKQARDNMYSEELKELSELATSLESITIPNREVSLKEFEYYLLPYLIHEVEHTDETTIVFKHNFLELAKVPTAPLNVMKGKELVYVLPPIMTGFKDGDMDGINYHKIIVSYFDNLANIPSMAERTLAKQLSQVSTHVQPNTDGERAYVNTMLKIYKDYESRILSNRTKLDESLSKQEVPVDKVEVVEEEVIEEGFFDY